MPGGSSCPVIRFQEAQQLQEVQLCVGSPLLHGHLFLPLLRSFPLSLHLPSAPSIPTPPFLPPRSRCLPACRPACLPLLLLPSPPPPLFLFPLFPLQSLVPCESRKRPTDPARRNVPEKTLWAAGLSPALRSRWPQTKDWVAQVEGTRESQQVRSRASPHSWKGFRPLAYVSPQ